MKIRIMGLVVGFGALAAWGVGCGQPTIDCRALHGQFAAKYTLLSGDPMCLNLPGDVIGVQSYYHTDSTGKNVDLSRSFLAIGTGDVRDVCDEAVRCGADPDFDFDRTAPTCEASKKFGPMLNSESDFAKVEPTENGVCPLAGTATSKVELPATTPNMTNPEEPCEGSPATSITYEWKNVRVLVSPANPGNLIKADLTYTKDGCTATYSVVALAPSVACYDEDADGNLTPNDAYCDPLGKPVGSGISIDFAPKCDPDTLHCVPTNTELLP